MALYASGLPHAVRSTGLSNKITSILLQTSFSARIRPI